MKLFYKRKYDYTTEYGIFGIKIKLTNLKKKLAILEQKMQHSEHTLWRLTDGDLFLYNNDYKFTMRDFEQLISKKFYEILGYYPNLKNPKTFNEKINWLKLNYYNPIENLCCDKYEVKKYVEEKIGKEYVIPTYGIWEDVNDIDFDSLPEAFVLKNTLSGGTKGVKTIKNKSITDIDKLKYELNNLLFFYNNNHHDCIIPHRREIKERIIAEKYMEQIDGQLYDYKFFCFQGEPKFLTIIMDRPYYKQSFFNMNFEKLQFDYGFPQIIKDDIRPHNFKEMIEISKKLSADFQFARVDLYSVKNKVYFGEITFNPCGGYATYPYDWDLKIGKMLDLTNIDKKYLINQKAEIHMVVRERERVILLPVKKVQLVA